MLILLNVFFLLSSLVGSEKKKKKVYIAMASSTLAQFVPGYSNHCCFTAVLSVFGRFLRHVWWFEF